MGFIAVSFIVINVRFFIKSRRDCMFITIEHDRICATPSGSYVLLFNVSINI